MTNKEKALIETKSIIEELKKNHINHLDIIQKDYNFEITAKINNQLIKILVYFGKKGVKIILQGNQNTDEYKILNQIISKEPILNFKETKLEEPNEYIGSDECGKGDFFGPLVVSALFVNEQIKKKLYEIGVKDSKSLSENQIEFLAKKIKEISKDNISIIVINPKKYNELYDKFKNLNKILNWAHSKAIETLLEKTKCKTVIIDKFSKSKITLTEKNNYNDVNFIFEEKAEKYIAVAGASILARYTFNQWFIKMEKLGLNLPKGSSIITEEKARYIFNNINIDKKQICKLHFKTLKKVSLIN